MKIVLAVAAPALAAAGSAPPADLGRPPPAAPAREQVLYGPVKSLTRKGGRFELRFDPAWWLTGLAAKRAALEDTGSSEVPNDYYIVEEGHRLLTFPVAASAGVTVVARTAGPVGTARIGV